MDENNIQNINVDLPTPPTFDVPSSSPVPDYTSGLKEAQAIASTIDFDTYYESLYRKELDAALKNAQDAANAALQKQAEYAAQINPVDLSTVQSTPQFSAGVGSVLPDAGAISVEQLQPQTPQFSAGDANIGFNAGNVSQGQLEAISLNPSHATAVYGVIAAEAAAGSAEDARAVADVIINRCRSGAWGGKDPLSVVSATGQFSVWRSGAYKVKSLTPAQMAAVNEEFNKAAAGLPTTYGYQSFRSNGTTGYSNNQVAPGGNRYR